MCVQGVTGAFLLRSRSALAALYDMDPACLEKFHSFRAFELLTRRRNGLLDGLPAGAATAAAAAAAAALFL